MRCTTTSHPRARTILAALALSSTAAVTAEAQVTKRTTGAVGELDPTATTATTAAPRVRELLCRGSAGGFPITVAANPSPRMLGEVTLRLEYRRSATPPGPDWKALEAGTCSWSNEETAPPEPGHVLFDTPADARPPVSAEQAQKQAQHGTAAPSPTAAEQYPDTSSIPRYLRDPSHYWVFYVADTGQQVALSHAAWTPSWADQIAGRGIDTSVLPTEREAPVPTGTRAIDSVPPPTSREVPTPLGTRPIEGAPPPTSRERPPAPGTGPLGDSASRSPESDVISRWTLGGVQVRPSLENVHIVFRAGPRANPVVRVSTEPPVQDPSTGRWVIPASRALRVTSQRSGSAWRYSAREAATLDRGTTYHYVIEVPAGSAGAPEPQQTVGTFTTWTQYAKVVFTELEIRNDGDHGVARDGDDDGEIQFVLQAGVGDPSGQSTGLPRRNYSSGARVPLTVETSMELVQAPDRLRLVVTGHEEDLLTLFLETAPRDPETWDRAARAQENLNHARGELDLASIRGRTGRIPFTLRSWPNGEHVAFDVTGYVEVVRR